MPRILMPTFSISLILAISAVGAQSQQPSLEEAVTALDGLLRPGCEIARVPCTDSSMTLENRTVVRFSKHSTMNGSATELTAVFDLRQLDGATIKNSCHLPTRAIASVSTFNGQRTLTGHEDLGHGPHDGTGSDQTLRFGSADACERGIKVLAYAIQAAQGTPTQQATAEFREAAQSSGHAVTAPSGPTAAETAAWIRARIPVVDEGQEVVENKITTQYSWFRDGGAVTRWATISMSTVTGVTADTCTLREARLPCVRVTARYILACPTRGGDCTGIPQAYVFLSENATQQDADKMVKAIKHLAELNGASLPKDDLF